MILRLVDLDATFLERIGRTIVYRDGLVGANGIRFCCPACSVADPYVKAHPVTIWLANRGVPDDAAPLPHGEFRGDGVHNLTIWTAIETPCWRGRIVNGCASIL